MQTLENSWEPVKLQTGWQIEQCTKPITPVSTTPPHATDPTLNAVGPEQELQITSNPNDHVSFLGVPQPSTQSPTN